jgi:tetratricopeptide (TPR) repeat protein
LFVQSRNLTEVAATPVYQRLSEVLQRTLSRANLLPPDEMTDAVQVAALVELGNFYEHLQREDAALAAYGEALAIEPQNEPALTARGILRYGRSTSASIRDFQTAISRGAHTVWPFFYMAHHALVTRQYQHCLLYCREGLGQPSSDAVRADLLEWRAIARFQASGRIDDVLADFDEAARLAPNNPRINRNRTEMIRAMDAQQTQLPWQEESEVEAGEIGRRRPALA